METIAYILGLIAAPFVLYAWAQSHNQPGQVSDRRFQCSYCPWAVEPGQKMVFGHKGWGHVECVPKVRRRVFNRW